MGQGRSKENIDLSKSTHFSTEEISNLRQNVKQQDQNNITEDVFKDSVKQCLPSVSSSDDLFLKRLYAAFGGDQEKSIDFRKFVDGLSVFMKGTFEEKLKLSFRLYDVDKDGFISKDELELVMLQLSQISEENEDQSEEIQRSIDCMFKDFDVDGDGRLSFEEYKLSAMKEPLIADFLERFLDQHNITNNKRPLSRASSVRSRKSSPVINPQHRLSLRLTQAELLDFSHQQQLLNNNLSETSPRSSEYLSFTPVSAETGNDTTPPSPQSSASSSNGRSSLPHWVSRGPSMASLDAAMVSM
ncbi:hypothetical protein BDF21DRAFT_421897 [Thamnidium elegans]|nr:hypothetical protein BDF21DRAFT_421897 [Thamnidium elegans]